MDAATGTPVYGRLTCALEMKVYEGFFAVGAEGQGCEGSRPGERDADDHGLGATGKGTWTSTGRAWG